MIYDVAIIGGGPAGYSAALEAAKHNMSVVLFEEDNLGGTCLNRGCIPTKFLIHTSNIYSEMNNSLRYGLKAKEVDFDFESASKEMYTTIQILRDGLESQLKSEKINIVNGTAVLENKNTILCNRERFGAKYIILATGSNSAKPLIDGAYTSDDALNLNHIPEKVNIIGGGVIAIEFANIFNKLGSEVSLYIRGERLLRKWDKELALSISQNLKKDGIIINTRCSFDNFGICHDAFILSAVGRRPRTSSFTSIDIELDDSGAVITNEDGMTNIDGVYAAGDVVSGSLMLAHTAMEQGRNIIKRIAGITNIKKSAVSNCIYTSPEASSVGFTESEAKEKGYDVVTGKINMVSNAMTLIHTDKRSYIKVIADKKSHKIIGAQLLCERASDISNEFVIEINNNLTVEDLRDSLHPHPSFSEAIHDVTESLERKLNEV